MKKILPEWLIFCFRYTMKQDHRVPPPLSHGFSNKYIPLLIIQ